MSQKISKRSRHRAGDDAAASFKTPGSSSKNKDDTNSKHESSDEEFSLKGFSNGNTNSKKEGENGTDNPARVIQTRSRSSTPLINKPKNDDSNGDLEKVNGDRSSETAEVNSSQDLLDLSEPLYEEVIDEHVMGPLVLEEDATFDLPKSDALPDIILEKDEVVSELQFEETDRDSVSSESSPNNRCRTRRAENALVATPKTPQIRVQNVDEVEALSIENDDISDSLSSVSTDNISTKAVVGSDVTRNADITDQEQDITVYENSYVSPNRSDNSFRSLSSRRSIRPITNDYRKFVLKNNANCDYEFEKLTTGIKRKDRSGSPENTKRFKDGILSYLTSPINNIRNTFSKSSTPQLVAYEKKDGEFASTSEEVKVEDAQQNGQLERKWCSIM